VGLHFTVILNQGSSRIPLTLLPFTPTRPATFLRRKTSKCQATRKAGIIKFPKEKSPARTYEVWTDQPGLGRRNAKLKALPKGWAQDRQAFRFFFFLPPQSFLKFLRVVHVYGDLRPNQGPGKPVKGKSDLVPTVQ
jgi:hypothetical protein